MKKTIVNIVAVAMACFTSVCFAGEKAKVYFTSDISPKGILKIYNAINSNISGKVAIKCHTGEPHGPNIIPPAWVKEVQDANIPSIIKYMLITNQSHGDIIREICNNNPSLTEADAKKYLDDYLKEQNLNYN